MLVYVLRRGEDSSRKSTAVSSNIDSRNRGTNAATVVMEKS
jgi:hypothetical protein